VGRRRDHHLALLPEGVDEDERVMVMVMVMVVMVVVVVHR